MRWTTGYCYPGQGWIRGVTWIDNWFHTYILNPIPTANFTYMPSNPILNKMIQFNDSSIDYNGQITTWLWDFGDGNISNSQNPTYQFTTTGTYSVSLTVTDNDGYSDTITKSIVVVRPSEEVQNLIDYIKAMNIDKG